MAMAQQNNTMPLLGDDSSSTVPEVTEIETSLKRDILGIPLDMDLQYKDLFKYAIQQQGSTTDDGGNNPTTVVALIQQASSDTPDYTALTESWLDIRKNLMDKRDEVYKTDLSKVEEKDKKTLKKQINRIGNFISEILRKFQSISAVRAEYKKYTEGSLLSRAEQKVKDLTKKVGESKTMKAVDEAIRKKQQYVVNTYTSKTTKVPTMDDGNHDDLSKIGDEVDTLTKEHEQLVGNFENLFGAQPDDYRDIKQLFGENAQGAVAKEIRQVIGDNDTSRPVEFIEFVTQLHDASSKNAKGIDGILALLRPYPLMADVPKVNQSVGDTRKMLGAYKKTADKMRSATEKLLKTFKTGQDIIDNNNKLTQKGVTGNVESATSKTIGMLETALDRSGDALSAPIDTLANTISSKTSTPSSLTDREKQGLRDAAEEVNSLVTRISRHIDEFVRQIGIDPLQASADSKYDRAELVLSPPADSTLKNLLDNIDSESNEKTLQEIRTYLKDVIAKNAEVQKELESALRKLRKYPSKTDLRVLQPSGGGEKIVQRFEGLMDVGSLRTEIARLQRELQFMTNVSKDILDKFQSISSIKALQKSASKRQGKSDKRIEQLKKQQEFFKDPANVETYYNRIIYLVILVSGWIFFVAVGFSYVWKANKDLEFKRTIHMFNTRKFPSLLNNVKDDLDNIYTLKNYLVNPADVDKRKINLLLAYHKLVPRGPSKYEYTPDSSIVYNETEAIQHVINKIKRKLYKTHISMVQTYEQNNFFKIEATALPFPWAEVFLNLLLIAVCVGVIAAVYMKYNPYDLAHDIRTVKACDQGDNDELQGRRCEIIEDRQALDTGFQKSVIGIAIFIVTLYVALNIISSTLSYEQALYYLSSRSILA
jgi:hypothetical protein